MGEGHVNMRAMSVMGGKLLDRAVGLVGASPRQRARRPKGLRLRGLVALVAIVLASGVAAPLTASAAFPGTNGVIVYAAATSPFSPFCGGWRAGLQLFTQVPGSSFPSQLTCTRGFDLHPFVSPDGSEVVFSSIGFGGTQQLYTVPLNGGHHHAHQPTLVSDAPQARDDYPSWSPSGDGTIVFQRTNPGALSQLFTENVNDPQSAAPVFPTATGFNDTQPVYDPSDPDLIVFVRQINSHSQIFSYDTSSGILTDLSTAGGSNGDDAKPDFSSDGHHLVFQSDRSCNAWQLYTMSVQGNDQSPVFPQTGPTSACATGGVDPVFSPDDGSIAFDRRMHWGEELAVVPVDGSGQASGSMKPLASPFFGFFGQAIQPNWGPNQTPPAQTTEAPLPIILPIAGFVAAGAALTVRRRRNRARSALRHA
jgi:hypothetical protein